MYANIKEKKNYVLAFNTVSSAFSNTLNTCHFFISCFGMPEYLIASLQIAFPNMLIFNAAQVSLISCSQAQVLQCSSCVWYTK